jgi:multidrug resistance efflux pump
LLLTLSGCGLPEAEAESTQKMGRQSAQTEAATVNVAIARTGNVQETLEYTGTTQPFREISLRSQVQAQLIDLTVDVGDRVSQGQPLARLNGAVQTATVAEAQAEVAALQAEVADAQAQVTDARTQVNRAEAELQQARSDYNRLQFLAQQGAISIQEAEQAQTEVSAAEATLRSTQEQVRSRQQQVAAAQNRVQAQRAVVAQEQQQQSFTVLVSPVTGSVVARSSELGNLVQPGNEVLRLGDFSQIKIAVQVSELELGTIRPGQAVQVRLDAFPEQTLTGRVSRISPAADPVARLVPIEVTIPNVNGRIGSGLLARVSFNQRTNRSRVLVPETALLVNQERRGNQASGGNNQTSPSAGDRASTTQQSGNSQPGIRNLPRDIGTIFVVAGSGNEAKVTARSVTLGRRGDGQVEVISGLEVGDRYVARSSKALKNGDAVRLSILSEQPESEQPESQQ